MRGVNMHWFQLHIFCKIHQAQLYFVTRLDRLNTNLMGLSAVMELLKY